MRTVRTVYTRWAYNRDLRMMLRIPVIIITDNEGFPVGAWNFSTAEFLGTISITNPISYASNRMYIMTTWNNRDVKQLMEAFR